MSSTDAESIMLPALPLETQSAPASLQPSRHQSPRHERPRRLVRSKSFSKLNVSSSASSPTRATRRRMPRVVFGTEPKAIPSKPACPVHSYSSVVSLLKTSGAIPFGKPYADAKDSDAPQVHAYAEPSSTLKRTGALPFVGKPKDAVVSESPAVHAYADPTSTLKCSGATAFAPKPRDEVATDSPSIHAYAAPHSTLKRSGAAGFARAVREGAISEVAVTPVHAYQALGSSLRLTGGCMAMEGRAELRRGTCPVHSYGALPSTLKKSGVASFGRPLLLPTPRKLKPSVLPPITTPRPASPSAVEDCPLRPPAHLTVAPDIQCAA